MADELARLDQAIIDNSLGRAKVIRRMTEPEDIAGAVQMLAGKEARWITGRAIIASGGNAFGL